MSSWSGRSGRVGAGGTGAAVRLEPVGAHLITSCRDVDGDLSGPRAAAHRRPTLGSRRRLREHLRGGHLEGSCHGVGRVDSLRQLMRGYWAGSWAGQGTAGQQRRHGPDCRHGEKRWGRTGAPPGCRPTGLPAAAMTRQGRRSLGSHRPWCCAVTLAAAQQFHFGVVVPWT